MIRAANTIERRSNTEHIHTMEDTILLSNNNMAAALNQTEGAASQRGRGEVNARYAP